MFLRREHLAAFVAAVSLRNRGKLIPHREDV